MISTVNGIVISIARMEKDPDLPDYNPRVRCMDHTDATIEDGFGMAGGGFGMYTYCRECGRVLSKSDVE